jgi:hypothetical protein
VNDQTNVGPELKVVTKAEWELTQARIRAAINAIYDLREMAEKDGNSNIVTACDVVIDQDIQFEVDLGM